MSRELSPALDAVDVEDHIPITTISLPVQGEQANMPSMYYYIIFIKNTSTHCYIFLYFFNFTLSQQMTQMIVRITVPIKTIVRIFPVKFRSRMKTISQFQPASQKILLIRILKLAPIVTMKKYQNTFYSYGRLQVNTLIVHKGK